MTFHRGKGKFKGKLPIMCFNCNEVGDIVARCPKKKNNRSGDKYRSERDEDNKDKAKKSCYIAKEETKDGSNNYDYEVVYVVIKNDLDKDEATALVSYVNKSGRCIIDSGCSHHMTRDKSKCIILDY